MIEPNNSIEDGPNATKDLISVPLMTRKVRLHHEQYCVSDVGANVSNTRHQSVMVARAPCSPSSQIRPDTRCDHKRNIRASSASAWFARVGLTNGSCRSKASGALQLGSSSGNCESAISGKSSATVLRRVEHRRFLLFSGSPSTNWPPSDLLPRSSQ